MHSRFNLTNAEMAAALRISAKTLRRMREKSILRPGIHYVTIGTIYRWDPKATDEALAMKTRKLK